MKGKEVVMTRATSVYSRITSYWVRILPHANRKNDELNEHFPGGVGGLFLEHVQWKEREYPCIPPDFFASEYIEVLRLQRQASIEEVYEIVNDLHRRRFAHYYEMRALAESNEVLADLRYPQDSIIGLYPFDVESRGSFATYITKGVMGLRMESVQIVPRLVIGAGVGIALATRY